MTDRPEAGAGQEGFHDDEPGHHQHQHYQPDQLSVDEPEADAEAPAALASPAGQKAKFARLREELRCLNAWSAYWRPRR